MRKALVIIFTIIVTSISLAGQTAAQTVDTLREQERLHRRWWVSMSLASVYDTNITHDEQLVGSFGLVPSFGVHFRDNAERPSFEADYEVALHRYNHTDNLIESVKV